jgi:hypothetical protein
MVSVVALLAEQEARIPELAGLEWDITGQTAVADLDRLIKMYTVTDRTKGGRVLVVEKGPDTLNLVQCLHAAGWKRGTAPCSTPGWVLTASITQGGATVRVQGYADELPDGTDCFDAEPHSTMDYWSPAPPPLGRSNAAKALSKEYMDRMATGDWDNWTATPFHLAPQ